VQQRVAHALLKLVKQAGKKTEEGILIDFPISRQDIAEMTGTTTAHSQSAAVGMGRPRIGQKRAPEGDGGRTSPAPSDCGRPR